MPDTNDHRPLVAVVLPPREGFSAQDSGAIALLTRRLAAARSAYRRVVVGRACAAPFAGIEFRAVRPALLGIGRMGRYARGAAVQAAGAALIEVHNQPHLAMTLARLCPGARVSLFVHNDPLALRGLRRPGERTRAARRLAGIVCVSDYLAERLRGASPDLQCVVLPNCIDPAEVPASATERERLILFVGRLTADKGADSFVAGCRLALPQLPGWRAEMIGADRFETNAPQTPFTRQLKQQAEAAGVRLLGFRPHGQVLEAMARAAVVVVPSRWQEPFGLTALEAMACGAALVCSGRGGLEELTHGVAVRCDPDRPESVAAAMVRAAAAPAGEEGRRRAAGYHVADAAHALDVYRGQVIQEFG